MKKFFPLLVALLGLWQLELYAQSVPQGINYQTIVRGSTDTPLADMPVTLFFQIRDGAGALLYSEKQTKTTNSNGLINLIIGQGQVQTGNFQNIDWSAGPRSMTVSLETSPNVFDELGIVQLMSVPFAMYTPKSAVAATAGNLADLGAQPGQILTWNGTAWAPGNLAADTNPNDDLTISSSAGGDVSGPFSNLQINANAVASNEIATGAIVSEKIADAAVTYAKIDHIGASTGMVLKFNGANWAPADDLAGGNGAIYFAGNGIEVTGTSPNFTIVNTGDTDPQDDLTNNSSAGGDLSGLFSDLQLNTDAVTGNEIANEAVGNSELADNAVSTTKIANGAVSYAKLDNTGAGAGMVLKFNGSAWAPADDIAGGNGAIYLAGNGIDITGVSPDFNIVNTGDTDPNDDITTASNAGGDVNGTFSNLQLNANVVTSLEIAVGAVGSSEIATDAVGSAEIGNGAVDNSELADNAVSTAKIASGAVTYAKLDNAGASAGKVLKYNGSAWAPADDVSGGNGASYLAGNGIEITGTAPNFTVLNTGDTNPNDDLTNTSTAAGDISGPFSNLQINANAVGATEIAADAVGASEIATEAVGSAEIAVAAVGTVELADNAVTNAKIADNAVNTAELANGAVTAAKLNQMGATLDQVLAWNGGAWVPTAAGSSAFSNCGRLNSPDLQERIVVSNNQALCPGVAQMGINTTLPRGMELAVNAGGDVLGLRLEAKGGTNTNDGALLLARSTSNRSNGLKIAAGSDNPGNADIAGLRLVAGGNESDIPEDGNSIGQNYGIFLDVLDRTSNNGSASDIGLYIRTENPADNWAILTEGSIGTIDDIYADDVIVDDDLYLRNPAGILWRFDVNDNTGLLGLYFGATQVGSFAASGQYTWSDETKKERIESLQQVLPKLLQLDAKSYNYTLDPDHKKTIGFLAQNIAQVFPELTLRSIDDEGEETLMVNYAGLSAVAIQAIKEQQQVIDTQQAQLLGQATRLNALEKEMAELKAMIRAGR